MNCKYVGGAKPGPGDFCIAAWWYNIVKNQTWAMDGVLPPFLTIHKDLPGNAEAAICKYPKVKAMVESLCDSPSFAKYIQSRPARPC